MKNDEETKTKNDGEKVIEDIDDLIFKNEPVKIHSEK